MAEVPASERNQKVIDEFRANQGRVGGAFEGAPMILVHHRGRRSGDTRVNPLVYQPIGDRWAVFASAAGRPRHPDWYLNLVAHPRTTIEVGAATHEVVARTAEGEERERIWARQKELMPGFADYEEKAGAAGRTIPVIVFDPVTD